MSYQDKLQQIDSLQAAIEAHGPLAQDILNKINYKLRLEWNYTSNSMEGNSLTKQETRSVMVGNITVGGKPIKDVLEMKGHDDLISDILKMGKGEVNISEKRVKEIHKAIVHEEDPAKRRMIGQWKTDNNYVYNYKNERFDLALLKKRLGQPHDAKAEIKYSKGAIQKVVNQTIIPLAKAWEQRLTDFDVLFQSRANIITIGHLKCKGDSFKETLPDSVVRAFASSLNTDDLITEVQLICEFDNLHSIKEEVSIRGELRFSFYDHSYEVTYPQTGLHSIVRLYDQPLSNEEIAMIIEKEGTLLYEKIEKALEERQ